MNNKYDVKNFSDLIDQFKVEDEMATIDKEIKEQKQPIERQMTIFDPFFEEGTGKYDFAAYVPRRYNLENLDENLLLEPPLALKDHKN